MGAVLARRQVLMRVRGLRSDAEVRPEYEDIVEVSRPLCTAQGSYPTLSLPNRLRTCSVGDCLAAQDWQA